MDTRLFHRKHSFKSQEIDDALVSYHSAVSKTPTDENEQQQQKQLKISTLNLISEILYTSAPFPDLSFLLSVYNKVHNSLAFDSDDTLSQWHWMKLLTSFPANSVTARTAEQCINECREYVKKAHNDFTRSMICLLMTSYTRFLDIHAQQFITQLTIVIKNLKAILLDSLHKNRYMPLSHLMCTSSIVDLSLHWFERLEKQSPPHAPPPTSFVQVVLKVLFHVLLNTQPPYPPPEESFISLSTILPQVTGEGVKALIQQQRLWTSLPSVVTLDVLRCCLVMLKRYTKQPEGVDNMNGADRLTSYPSHDTAGTTALHDMVIEEGSLTYILQALGTPVVFETILSLPNFLSELLSGLLLLLTMHIYALLDLRLQAICLIINFLSIPDCSASGIHTQGIDWDALFADSCAQDSQLNSVCEIVTKAFGAYAAVHGISTRVKQIVIPPKFSRAPTFADGNTPTPTYPYSTNTSSVGQGRHLPSCDYGRPQHKLW